MKNTLILVGAVDEGKLATNGETMKNQLLLRRFRALFDKTIVVDTYHWRKRPWVIIQLFFVLLFHQRAKVVLSASQNVKYLLKFLYYFPIHNNVYCWVVGGSHAQLIRDGVYKLEYFKRIKKIIVQGKSMVEELNQMGLFNVVHVPNSKPIIFTPSIETKKVYDPFKFVYLSRIHPDKGIAEIIESCSNLEKEGYKGRFIIDFYGSFDTDYEKKFKSLISNYSCISYKGYLNLMTEEGYSNLSSYNVMLFPTYWDGEGFPGVVLDANIAGVPIIATDWNLNSEVVKNGETGVIIPIKDTKALSSEMANFIDGKYNMERMVSNCIEYVKQFDYKRVISKELMIELGLLR